MRAQISSNFYKIRVSDNLTKRTVLLWTPFFSLSFSKEPSSYFIFSEKISLQFFPENFSRRRLGDDVNKLNPSFKPLVLRQVGANMRLNHWRKVTDLTEGYLSVETMCSIDERQFKKWLRQIVLKYKMQNAEKCREVQRSVEKCREMSRNAEKFR